MQQFATFFELLDKRGTPEAETEHSWTVDFGSRRRHAAEEAAPHRRKADAQREKAAGLREQAKACRKADQQNLADALQTEIESAERQAREATAKAQAIEDAVYDLKAVNPREKKVSDTRTPAELLAAIAAKGRDVEAALQQLRSLLSEDDTSSPTAERSLSYAGSNEENGPRIAPRPGNEPELARRVTEQETGTDSGTAGGAVSTY